MGNACENIFRMPVSQEKQLKEYSGNECKRWAVENLTHACRTKFGKSSSSTGSKNAYLDQQSSLILVNA
jgi:hypothetical protein